MRKLTSAAVILFAALAAAQQPATASSAHSHHVTQPVGSPEKIWSELMEGNKRFVSGRLTPEDWIGIRKSLTNEQHPKVMVGRKKGKEHA